MQNAVNNFKQSLLNGDIKIVKNVSTSKSFPRVNRLTG